MLDELQQVIHISKSQCEQFSKTYPNDKKEDIAIISITDTHSFSADIEGFSNILRMKFDDISAKFYEFDESVLFDDSHANEIIKFLVELPENIHSIIVHCEAGISRSAAVAKFIDKIFGINEFDEEYDRYNTHVYRVLMDSFEKAKIISDVLWP